VSKQKKAMNDHDDAKLIGWSISNLLSKENPENSTSANRAGLRGTKDVPDYLRRYNSLLIDGRLKDSVDLLESMEQKGLLDMNKVVTCSNSPFFSVYLLLFPDFHLLSDPPC
jgi:hypothetical protein